jgi:hypothetical protein
MGAPPAGARRALLLVQLQQQMLAADGLRPGRPVPRLLEPGRGQVHEERPALVLGRGHQCGWRSVRHRWLQVSEDVRRSVQEPRHILHRCRHCMLWRATRDTVNGWATLYGWAPYHPGWRKRAPECNPIEEYEK